MKTPDMEDKRTIKVKREEAGSLCQFYDQLALDMGYRSWNHLCADLQPNLKDWLKKCAKRARNGDGNSASLLANFVLKFKNKNKEE